jgi:hypothetical protein
VFSTPFSSLHYGAVFFSFGVLLTNVGTICIMSLEESCANPPPPLCLIEYVCVVCDRVIEGSRSVAARIRHGGICQHLPFDMVMMNTAPCQRYARGVDLLTCIGRKYKCLQVPPCA